MTILERAVSTMQQLPIEKQQEALSFIEFLVFKLGDRQVKDDYSLIPARRSLENLYGICADDPIVLDDSGISESPDNASIGIFYNKFDIV
ncbi:hypothetical protein [Pseudanabaena minima]|uniref:hypothetical protein n=1 Tax=Pseudanabaena minima TaxID=890415 RepID=UPI003DA8779E